MAKYDPLRDRLKRSPEAPLTLSFREIDELVDGLPASASDHDAWWGNETGSTTHVQARAWLAAGRTVEEVRLGQWVRFSAARGARGTR